MHTHKNKKQILTRVNRIKGQLDAVSKLLESDQEDCYEVMQVLASCRGALNGLMGDIVEEHLKEHVINAQTKENARRGGQEITKVLKSFWK